MEGHAFIHAVLGILGDFQTAAFQFIAEGHSCRPAGHNRNLLGGRLYIVILRLFGDGVNTNGQIVHGDGSVCPGLDILFNPVAGNMELHAGYLAVLRSFHQLKAAHSSFHLGIGFHRIRQFNADNHILQGRSAIRHQLCAGGQGRQLPGCGDCHRIHHLLTGSDGQFIAGHTDLYRTVRACKTEIGQAFVAVRQRYRVVGAVPIKLITLSIALGTGHKTRNGAVRCHCSFNLLVNL